MHRSLGIEDPPMPPPEDSLEDIERDIWIMEYERDRTDAAMMGDSELT
jgi:hypothetical protein